MGARTNCGGTSSHAGLATAIRDLAGDDAEARAVAAELILATWGDSYSETSADAFGAIVSAVFSDPAFPTATVLRAMIRGYMATLQDYHRKLFVENVEDLIGNHAAFSTTTIAIERVVESCGPGARNLVGDFVRLLERDTPDGQAGDLAARALASMGPTAEPATNRLLKRILRDGCNEWPNHKIRALVALTTDDAPVVRRLIEALSDERSSVREAACAALDEFGVRATAAVPALLAATRLPHEETRSMAAMALGGTARDDEAAVDRLIEMTGADEWFVRGNAIDSLGRIGMRAEIVVPLAIRLLDDDEGCDWSASEAAVRALAAFGPQSAIAVEKLIDRIVDEDGNAVYDVVEALGCIGAASSPALDTLRSLLSEEWVQHDRVREAICRIEDGLRPS